jgi:hypothetical protein
MGDGAVPMRSSGHFMLIVHVRAKRFLGCFTDRQRCIRKPWRAENVGLADTIGAAFGPGARRKGRRQPGPGPCLPYGALKGPSGSFTRCWRPGAKRRSMSRGAPSRVVIRFRKNFPRRQRRNSRPSSRAAGLTLPDQADGPLPEGLGRWRLPRLWPEKADSYRNFGSYVSHPCQTPGDNVLRDEAER